MYIICYPKLNAVLENDSRLYGYRLALPDLHKFIEMVPPSCDVMFNIKTYSRASFGGARITFFFLIKVV